MTKPKVVYYFKYVVTKKRFYITKKKKKICQYLLLFHDICQKVLTVNQNGVSAYCFLLL